MKMTLFALSFIIMTQAHAYIRCSSQEDPTESVRRGDSFKEDRPESFIRTQNDPELINRKYKILSFEEARFVKSQKLSEVSGGSSCRRQWTYALIDYVAQMPDGETCEDTFVYPYKDRLTFSSCPGTNAFGAAYLTLISPFLGAEFVMTSMEKGYLDTPRGMLNKMIELKFQNKM